MLGAFALLHVHVQCNVSRVDTGYTELSEWGTSREAYCILNGPVYKKMLLQIQKLFRNEAESRIPDIIILSNELDGSQQTSIPVLIITKPVNRTTI